ncbi:MAG TPA: invasion associated locus B family protein [Methylocystis sp.]|nr:invasion associated locus B family protein [Methylocystis sp.]
MSLNVKLFAAAAAVALVAGGTASAQQAGAPPAGAPGQPPAKVDLVPIQATWNKICDQDQQTKKDVCLTTRDFGVQADQPSIAVALYEQKGAPEPNFVRLLMPLGTPIRAGFRIGVDKGSLESGSFEFCSPAGCVADAKLKPAFVDGMKKGEKLNILIKQPNGAETTLAVPLVGFGKSYDGPPIDPKVLEEQQKKLQEELQKKAEEQRKAQQGGSTAAPPATAPAPGKPPAGK